jgi:hypothetical protein
MDHIGWRYYPNPRRKYCVRWWLHWLDVVSIWRDLHDAAQRAIRGWGDGDIYDLMTYHAGVTIGLLKHFRDHHAGYIHGMTPEEYDAKIDEAIDGWEAKYSLLTSEYWGETEVRKALEERWQKGHTTFLEIYDSLWN